MGDLLRRLDANMVYVRKSTKSLEITAFVEVGEKFAAYEDERPVRPLLTDVAESCDV